MSEEPMVERLEALEAAARNPHISYAGFSKMFLDALPALLSQLREQEKELTDRRDAMHNIFWLNMDPRIEAMCSEVYDKWGGSR